MRKSCACSEVDCQCASRGRNFSDPAPRTVSAGGPLNPLPVNRVDQCDASNPLPVGTEPTSRSAVLTGRPPESTSGSAVPTGGPGGRVRETSAPGRTLAQDGSPAEFHSVLGDREKVSGTFREFMVYQNEAVYPEWIIWYTREGVGEEVVAEGLSRRNSGRRKAIESGNLILGCNA